MKFRARPQGGRQQKFADNLLRTRRVQGLFREREPLENIVFVPAGNDEPERVLRNAHLGGDFFQRGLRLAVLRFQRVSGLVKRRVVKN